MRPFILTYQQLFVNLNKYILELLYILFKKIVRIDVHFILGLVLGHHGSLNKIFKKIFKNPLTIQNSPLLFV